MQKHQENNTPVNPGMTRRQVAWLAAQEIPNGSYVNLGIGYPEMIADYVPNDKTVIYHSENGILGFGPIPAEQSDINYDLINAGKKPISLLPGGCFFDQAMSFAMIRGGHLDICFLGAMQVAENGDIANWNTGSPEAIPAVGGAMDLVTGVKNIIVLTDHTTKNGKPKLVEKCHFPLTGRAAVSKVYTNLGVFHITKKGFVLTKIAPGIEVDLVSKLTDANVYIDKSLETLAPPRH